MQTKNFLLSIIAGLGFSGWGAAGAQSSASAFEEALKKDAQAISRTDGISHEDALRRLRLQAAASDRLIAQLREEFAARLAGIYIEHDPVDRVVVRLKGDALVADRRLQVDSDTLLVEFISGQSHTQVEIEDIIDNHIDALKKSVPRLQGVFADDKTGEAVLTVSLRENDLQKIRGMREVAQKILSIPVRIHRISSPLENQSIIRGGGSLMGLGCTAGFVVRKTSDNTRGILTAAHCPGSATQIFTDWNGNHGYLKYKDGLFSSAEDVKWYAGYLTTQSSSFKPQFYADSTVNPRPLTGRRTQASTAFGMDVCHRGHATEYSCGFVFSTKYDLTDCSPYACAKTWVAVAPSSSTPELACYNGDSGGPWFISTVAIGIHKAGAKTGPYPGECEMAVYMSTDRISGLDLQLLYDQN